MQWSFCVCTKKNLLMALFTKTHTQQNKMLYDFIALFCTFFFFLCLFAAHKKNPLEISGDKKRLVHTECANLS